MKPKLPRVPSLNDLASRAASAIHLKASVSFGGGVKPPAPPVARPITQHTPLQYLPPKKVAIFGLEIDVDLIAQYNPKELQIEKSVTWNASANAKSDHPDLEFAAVGPRTLSMELLFDTYEEAHRDGRLVDVADRYVKKLMQLMSVMKPDSENEDEKRPSVVQVRWETNEHAAFEGVLQSVSTKYTMFAPNGTPVRATCTIKIMEATRPRRSSRLAPRDGRTHW